MCAVVVESLRDSSPGTYKFPSVIEVYLSRREISYPAGSGERDTPPSRESSSSSEASRVRLKVNEGSLDSTKLIPWEDTGFASAFNLLLI